MRSKLLAVILLAALAASVMPNPSAQTLSSPGSARFYPDDPLWRDDDMRSIAEPAKHDLSKSYEFVANTFRETARSFGPGAEREHARRGAGFELVYESDRAARHDGGRRASWSESG